MHKNETTKTTKTKKEYERARPTPRTGPVTLSSTEEQKQKRVAARAAAAMAQVLRRRPRSTVMWGRKKAVIKTYPDGGQEIIVPQTLTAEQQQYEFPPRSRFLKKLATDEKTDLRRFSNPPMSNNTPDQLALNEWFSNTLGRKTERISYKRKKSSCDIQLKSDSGKKWAHTLKTLEPPNEECSKYCIPKKLLKCSSPTRSSTTQSRLRHSGTDSVVSDINTIWKEYQKQTASRSSQNTNATTSTTSITSTSSNSRRRMDSSEKKNMSHFKSTSQSITNSRRSISNSRNLLNRDRTISQSISNSREKMISTSHSSINAQTMTNSPGITSRNRSRTISNSPSVMNSLNRTISSNMTHRARSRTIGTQPAENEQEKTPIGGMVQLIGLLHHSLKEQQQRSIDRMEKLESLLLEERQQRQQAEHKKDLTMKKFEHMYQQLQDHIEATKEDLSTSPPPSYQSLLMERVSSSLSGLERSMERHQLKKQSTPPVSISNQRRMAALRQ